MGGGGSRLSVTTQIVRSLAPASQGDSEGLVVDQAQQIRLIPATSGELQPAQAL